DLGGCVYSEKARQPASIDAPSRARETRDTPTSCGPKPLNPQDTTICCGHFPARAQCVVAPPRPERNRDIIHERRINMQSWRIRRSVFVLGTDLHLTCTRAPPIRHVTDIKP